MFVNFNMPTKLVFGGGCIRKNPHLFLSLGKRALIVTGRRSAKENGSLDDVTQALDGCAIQYELFDKVESNPSIGTVRAAAAAARRSKADFIVGIGGGSPMDAAKAAALLARQNLNDDSLFSGPYTKDILPSVMVPTTAGTGSEVTQYSILTNDNAKSKTSISTALIFPKIAFVDARYTENLALRTTINTAVDALCHCVEGMLSVKANPITDLLAADGIKKISGAFAPMLNGNINYETREELIYASTLGGMVIAQTGTAAVHSMGYSLTYFRHIEHGRANGLLLASFLSFVGEKDPEAVKRIFSLMGLKGTGELKCLMEKLLGQKEIISDSEFDKFSGIAVKAGNVANSTVVPSREDLKKMYAESFR